MDSVASSWTFLLTLNHDARNHESKIHQWRYCKRDLNRSTFVVWEMWLHHIMCWKWPPFASRQDWTRCSIFWKVLASTSELTPVQISFQYLYWC